MRSIFRKELKRFESSPQGRLKEISPNDYLKSEIIELEKLSKNTDEFIKRSLAQISENKKNSLF